MGTEPGEDGLGQAGIRAPLSCRAPPPFHPPVNLCVQGYSYSIVCNSERVETTEVSINRGLAKLIMDVITVQYILHSGKTGVRQLFMF